MTRMFVSDFDEWWDSYPRKVGKLAAQREYDKARRNGASARQLREGVGLYVAHKPSYADFAHPKTWLSQGRWMDDYGVMPRAPVESVDDMLARTGHWSVGCKRLHGGTCQSANEHYERVEAKQLQGEGA